MQENFGESKGREEGKGGTMEEGLFAFKVYRG